MELKKLVLIGKLIDINNEPYMLGANNRYINLISNLFGQDVYLTNGNIESNIENDLLVSFFASYEKLVMNNYQVGERELINLFEAQKNNELDLLVDIYLKRELITHLASGKPIYVKSINQMRFIDALDNSDITFAVGPAGTGKTFLAVCYAVSKLKANDIKRIVLVRPIVEAGEKLGFLPGDVKEKIDPYLIPIYDAFSECLGKEQLLKLIDKGIIEVAPLAYMRGRTIDNSIVILDEAQNATTSQMKMFLTRLGFCSKMIITGDITQIDLPYKNQSGLVEAYKLLDNIEGISIVNFEKKDVMRHPLVYKILEQYEKKEKTYENKSN